MIDGELMEGVIVKAVGGFYFVFDGVRLISCRARGRFRYEGVVPLVGDRGSVTLLGEDTGVLDTVAPRKNEFLRPPISNVDQVVIFASEAPPRTDPFLIDRIAAVGEIQGCGCVICINKCDLKKGDRLSDIYRLAGYPTLQVSAKTGENLPELAALLQGKTSVFTGNSGVGKSSILNALYPGFQLKVGEISEKLGRGRHTTRHVELFTLGRDTFAADTPGFSAFDTLDQSVRQKTNVQEMFRDFQPYVGQCRFVGCSHTGEQGCAVLEAVARGEISESRHRSYLRLYEEAARLERESFRPAKGDSPPQKTSPKNPPSRGKRD